jgi:hypothetical protein
MSGYRSKILFVIVMFSVFSIHAYSQQDIYADSLTRNNSQRSDLKPALHYSIGSTFTVIPHFGTLSGFTISPVLTVPLSPKWSVEGGIIAGRYYSALRNFNSEGLMSGSFNALSIYGSALYHVNSQLTLYGMGIKRLSETSPFYSLPKSSYTIGSNYNFGSFSIGLSMQMSKWNNNLSPLPFNGSHGFYSPYGQRLANWIP